MKLKTVFTALLGATALTVSTASLAATQIKVWCWDDYFNVPAARLAAEKYMKNHPDVVVKVESIGQPDIIQKLNASLGSKNYRGLPDVVLIEDYRVQNFIHGYPDFLRELKTVNTDVFVDYKVAASSSDGKHYGIPFDSGVVGNYIRTDLFEQAGYKPEDLQDITWDQYIDMGKKVKEKTGARLVAYDPSDLGLLRVMMQSAGVWYTDAEGKVFIKDNQPLKDALRIFKRLKDEELDFNISGWNQLLASFQQGKVSAVVQGCWITPSVEAGKDLAGKWLIKPLPKLNDSDKATHYSNLGGSQWYVNNHSKNAEIAENFLKETFASDVSLINDLVTKIGLVNSFADTSKMDNYQVSNLYFQGQKIYTDFADWNKKIPAVNYGDHTYAIESIVSEALQRVLAGEDIDTVLEESQVNAEMQIGL